MKEKPCVSQIRGKFYLSRCACTILTSQIREITEIIRKKIVIFIYTDRASQLDATYVNENILLSLLECND